MFHFYYRAELEEKKINVFEGKKSIQLTFELDFRRISSFFNSLLRANFHIVNTNKYFVEKCGLDNCHVLLMNFFQKLSKQSLTTCNSTYSEVHNQGRRISEKF